MDSFCRWRILVTRDLLSLLDHLVPLAPVDHLVLMVPVDHLVQVDHLVLTVPAVDHPATHPDLLSSRAQALEQAAQARVRWTPTTWSRRTEASGFGPRSARSGSGRLREEPSRFVLHIITLAPFSEAIIGRINTISPPGSGRCPGLWLIGLRLDDVAKWDLGSQDLLLVFPHSNQLEERRAGRSRHRGCSAWRRRRRTRPPWKQ